MSLRWVIAIAAVLGSYAPVVGAEQSRYSLSWVRGEGAESCPGEAALVHEIERRLGRSVFGSDGERSLEASVIRAGVGFRIDIYVRDGSGGAIGHRALGSDEATCEAIFSAAALALALVIDPEAVALGDSNARASVARFDLVETEPPQPKQPSPLPELPAPLPAAVSPPLHSAPPAPPHWPLTLSARGLATAGVVPEVSPGLALAVAGRPSARWGWAIAAFYVLEKRTRDAELGDFGLSATAASVSVSADLVDTGPLRLVASLGPMVGVLHTAVYAPTPDQPGDYAQLAVQADLRAQLEMTPRIFVELGTAGLLPLVRRNLATENQEPAWRQPFLAGFGFLGVGASIW